MTYIIENMKIVMQCFNEYFTLGVKKDLVLV